MYRNYRLFLKLLTIFSAFGIIAFSTADVQAQISVVVSKKSGVDVKKLEASDLREIFLGAKLKWPNGRKIQVIDQPATLAGRAFYKVFLKKTYKQSRQRWLKLALSGQASGPRRVESDDEVKALLKRQKNAIGFIRTEKLDDTLEEIFRVDVKLKSSSDKKQN